MEIKQLEYFLAVFECKSINKAAERLYTSQPNVSKVIKALEDTLGVSLLERTSKGVQSTSFGDQLYDYAKSLLATVRHIEEMAEDVSYEKLKLATFSSNMISRRLSDFYATSQNNPYHIHYFTGSTEEVIEHVHQLTANIGVIFYSDYQSTTIKQVLHQKNLVFHKLTCCNVCIYVGPNHPYYTFESVTFDDLENLSFIQGKYDYFSILDHIDVISGGKIKSSQLKHTVHTNSDHLRMNMLRHTNVCTFGIDFIKTQYHDNDIRKVAIDAQNQCVQIGYILRKDTLLSPLEQRFITHFKPLFEKAPL